MVTVYIKRDDLSCWVGKGNNMPVRVLKWSPVPVALTKRLNVEEGARAPCAGHCDSPAASGSPARREPSPAVCAVCEPGAGGTELATSLLLWGQCYRSSGMPCWASWMQSYPAGSQEASAGV